MQRINPQNGSRAAILQAAEWEFVTKGPEGVTLGKVAAEAGLPTSLVESQFASTADLYQAIVAPFDSALDTAIDRYAHGDVPLSPADRIALLAALVDIYCEHRAVVLLILRGISSNWPVHIDPQHSHRHERMVTLLAGDHATGEQRVVVDAVLGVITRPLLDPAVDTDDVRNRRLLVAMATDTAKRLGTAASRSWADGRRAPEFPHGLVGP